MHFRPIGHDEANDKFFAEKRNMMKAATAPGGSKSAAPSLRNLFASKPVAPKMRNVGGHEQSNHDEEHVQRHMEIIDKEHAASQAALDELKKVMAKEHAATQAALEDLKVKDSSSNKISSALDETSESIKTAQEAVGLKRSMRSPAYQAIKPPGPARPPSEDHRFSPNPKSDDEQTNLAEAANAIADLVEPGHKAKVAALRDAASNGDYEALTRLLDAQHVHLIHSKDENEWQLIHEAVRSGNLESVKLLIDLGADIGAKVLSGGAALWVAKYYLDEDHPVTQYLIDIGAPDEEL